MSKCLFGKNSSKFCCLFSFHHIDFFSVAALVVWKCVGILASPKWKPYYNSKITSRGWKCVQGDNPQLSLLHLLEYCRSYKALSLLASNSLRLLCTSSEVEASKTKQSCHFLHRDVPKNMILCCEMAPQLLGFFIVILFTIGLLSFWLESTDAAAWHKKCI